MDAVGAGADFGGYLRFLFALLFVLGLIWALAMVARRTGLGFPTAALKAARNRRLGVVEATPLDGRRRMALIRRDDVEHLVILSPTGETVVETGIKPPRPADEAET